MKSLFYEQVARIGKATASPKRLEIIELLCQSEKAVDTLASEAGISVKLTSAHLKELRVARLVEGRKEGRNIYYRLSDPNVAEFWVALRTLAEERLLELQAALGSMVAAPQELIPAERSEIIARAKTGEIVVIDVRPESEYRTGHLPYARSLPLRELKLRLDELPKNKPIVAYCRGPFCLMAPQAVEMLQALGFRAARLEDGVAEWRYHGLPIEIETERSSA
ncbi:MAG: metalloregulator ArsR/SmtB family transcription factor [Burkholderiales bacterium]|nr:metalloregulator ArsR/SmtB family transcription factor [Burkholderiales bacterium]